MQWNICYSIAHDNRQCHKEVTVRKMLIPNQTHKHARMLYGLARDVCIHIKGYLFQFGTVWFLFIVLALVITWNHFSFLMPLPIIGVDTSDPLPHNIWSYLLQIYRNEQNKYRHSHLATPLPTKKEKKEIWPNTKNTDQKTIKIMQSICFT